MFVKYVVCVCSILLHSIPHVRVTLYTLLTLTLLVKIVRGVVFNIFLLSTISGDVVSSNGRWTAAISLRLRRGFWTFFAYSIFFSLLVDWFALGSLTHTLMLGRSLSLSLHLLSLYLTAQLYCILGPWVNISMKRYALVFVMFCGFLHINDVFTVTSLQTPTPTPPLSQFCFHIHKQLNM